MREPSRQSQFLGRTSNFKPESRMYDSAKTVKTPFNTLSFGKNPTLLLSQEGPKPIQRFKLMHNP